jgi:benzoate/toluate 1,2-dioxygenase alpha subunit
MDLKDLKLYVDDRPDEGVFRVHRDVFADPALFELEQKYIFERAWSFLALESQLAQPHDFVAAHIGRVPVMVVRDAAGKLAAFLNVCRHKGAVLCRTETGNRKYHVCNYHGWAYDSAGRNVDVKDRKAACYAAGFDAEDHDLIPLARFANYKGLLFGSLNPEVPPLGDFLGELKFFLDCAMEQGPKGMEFVPGRITYTYDANWKLQMDNGVDAYHLTSTHTSFMDVVQRREQAKTGMLEARAFDWQKRLLQEGGAFNFRHGHTAIWLNQPQPEKRPVYSTIDEVRARVGDAKADWMLKLRNLVVFPNMQIADSTSLLLRTFRPLAVNKTEMRVYCLAPIGEAADVRAWRLRQFEDFFNVSGFATPDDTTLYEDGQAGFAAPITWLQGYQRGMGAQEPGANASAREIAIEPVSSMQGPYAVQTETCFQAPYREWARLMQAGVSGDKAY